MDYSTFYKDKKILITGGMGFIGSNLAIALRNLGSDICIVDCGLDNSGANAFNIAPIQNDVEVHMTDIRNAEMILELVKDVDIIFHLAGDTNYTGSMNRPFVDMDINCVATLILLQACRKNNPGVRIVYAGSIHEYGKKEPECDEKDNIMLPDTIYGVDKLSSELYLKIFHNNNIISYTALRLGRLYGPRCQGRYQGYSLLNGMIRLALEDQKIPIYGKGEQLIDYCFIDDGIEAFLQAGSQAKTAGKSYMIGSGMTVSLDTLAQTVIKKVKKGKIEYKEVVYQNHLANKEEVSLDYSSFHTDTHWYPAVGLEEGIQKTIEYYEENKKYYW